MFWESSNPGDRNITGGDRRSIFSLAFKKWMISQFKYLELDRIR